MSNFNADIYEEEQNVLQIRANTTLSNVEKREMICEIRKMSNFKKEGNSSMKTIMNLTNVNFGFTLLVFGLQFKTTGFLFGLIAFLIGLAITLKTALLQLVHCKSQDMDFTEIVERVMGPKSRVIYILASIFYINLNVLINFVYSADMLYSFVSYVADLNGVHLPGKDEFSFSTFSYQYSGIIMFFVYNAAFLIKDIKAIGALGPVGVFSVFIVVIFSLVQGILNMENASSVFHFEFNISDIAIFYASLAMGFFGHYYHLPIAKNNAKQENNKRDLSLSFYLTGALFILDSIFGAIAIADQKITDQASILDFFAKTWYIMVIRIMILIQLFTSVVFTTFLMKAKMWTLFPEDKEITTKMQLIVNFCFTIVWLMIQMFNVNITILITFAGGLGAFLGIYFFPIFVHMKCIYSHSHQHSHKKTNIFEPDNGIDERLINDEDVSDHHHLSKNDRMESLMETYASDSMKERCRSEHRGYMKTPKFLRSFVYGCFMIIGISVFIIRVYAMF